MIFRRLLIGLSIFLPSLGLGESTPTPKRSLRVVPSCFGTGKTRHISSGNNYFETRVLRSGRHAIQSEYNGDSLKIIELDTGKVTTFSKPTEAFVDELASGELAYTDFSSYDENDKDIKNLLKLLKTAQTTVINPQTGAVKVLKGKVALSWGKIYTATGTKGRDTLVLRADDGSIREIKIGESDEETWTLYRSDKSDPEVTFDPKAKTITFSKDGKDIYKASLPGLNQNSGSSGSFSPDKRLYVGNSPERPQGENARENILVFDLKAKTKKSYTPPKDYSLQYSSSSRARVISKDGSLALLYSSSFPSKGVMALNTSTGKFETLLEHENLNRLFFDQNDQICGSTGSYFAASKSIECYDPKTKKLSRRIPLT